MRGRVLKARALARMFMLKPPYIVSYVYLQANAAAAAAADAVSATAALTPQPIIWTNKTYRDVIHDSVFKLCAALCTY